ncbi:MAG: phosphodiester glycosidase family protein [Anaerolineales bacterium]|uniref:Phosphodiester glycosidase family protein n=1 Tax=Candidatus Desulfolinea nitratireducens TaxID=2841698 RepID=A0A8J6TJI4_9CHLR|nr:phosphodiester glycosidase family protein [Candidatus Desulfolinea nitratireducens]MBL6961472.1 phosphodiester glycosidase family protein [Anaerolineales bacterium]
MMKKKRLIYLGLLLFLLILIGLYLSGRPLPIEVKEELYDGIVYRRKVHYEPRLWIAHIITIDLHTEGINFIVTPPDFTEKDDEHPLRARTTSRFLEKYNLQIAVNGSEFTPWHSNSFLDYYPHMGDPVTPTGFTASRGKRYTEGNRPTLYIAKDNVAQFEPPRGKVYNAISGSHMLIVEGEHVEGLDSEIPAPRTAYGVDFGPDRLVIVVVDGRQPFYSEGATLTQLADLMIDYGVYTAINMDGGGSSTLVIEDESGKAKVLNSPINSYIPGRERPVANHLGVYVEQ